MSENKMAAISIRAPPCRTGTISWDFTTCQSFNFQATDLRLGMIKHKTYANMCV